MRGFHSIKSLQGLSLVELMVALLLGSFVAVAATQLFLINQSTNNLQNGLSSVQDQGRYAFSYISRDLMQAGYNSEGDSLSPFLFENSSIPGNEISQDEHSARYDRLVLQVNGGTDCVGNEFTGIKVYEMKENTQTGVTGLLCRIRWQETSTNDEGDEETAWKTTSETVVDYVEAFQVLYGVDTDSLGDSGYGAADYYATATDVSPALDRVVSVRYALLLASDRVVSTESAYAPTEIQVLDQVYDSDDINLSDGRAYRVYISTVGLRNQQG